MENKEQPKKDKNIIELTGNEINNAVVVKLPSGIEISLQSSERYIDDLEIMFFRIYEKLKSESNDKKKNAYLG